MAELKAEIKITETDTFDKLMKVIVGITNDERISKKVRQEYKDKLYQVTKNVHTL